MTVVLKRYAVPKILLIEDSKSDVLLIKKAIEKANIKANIDNIMDGEQALDYVFQIGIYKDAEPPDLILLDLNLVGSKVSGFEILLTIKDHPEKKKIPIIILTSSENIDDVNQAYGEHANAYLVKPNDVSTFAEIVNTLEKFWFQLVKLPRV